MKKTILFLTLNACSLISLGQTKLIIPVNDGPLTNGGGIYTLDSSGSYGAYNHIFYKSANEASTSPSKLVQHPNGFIYGVTNETTESPGTLIKFDPTTNNYSTVKKFDFAPNCTNPCGVLTIGSNGKIYGTTPQNPNATNSHKGSVFEYDPITDSISEIYKMNFYTNAKNTLTGTCSADNQNVYCIYRYGGLRKNGTIEKLNVISGISTKIYDFKDDDGQPSIFDGHMAYNAGKYYGVLNGQSNCSIYSIDKLTGNVTIENRLNFNTYAYLYGMIDGGDGFLYGLASGNYNQFIYKFDPVSKAVTIEFTFSDYLANVFPVNYLTLNGTKLYGVCQDNNNMDLYVYSYNLSTGIFVRELFLNTSIVGSYVKRINGSADNMYIASGSDGTGFSGTLSKYNYATNQIVKLADLGDGSTTGANIVDIFQNTANKTLFTCRTGGTFGQGEVYEYDESLNSLSTFFSFNPSDSATSPETIFEYDANKFFGLGASPLDWSSVLYGMEPSTGANTLFEHLKPLNANAQNPNSGLLEYNGKLYGVSSNNVIFRLGMNDNVYEEIADLNTIGGLNPFGELTLTPSGKMYGTTQAGGNFNKGILYEFDPQTNTLVKKIDFDGAVKGMTPVGALLYASNGKLYGLCNQGGSFGSGVIYSFDPSTSTFLKHTNLGTGVSLGRYCRNGFVQVNANEIYATSPNSTTTGNGWLFKYNITTNTYSYVTDFSGANGVAPLSTPLLASNGNLYGFTDGSGSNSTKLYQYNISSSVLSAAYTYVSFSNGKNPNSTWMHNGKIYSFVGTDNVIPEFSIYQYNPVTNTGQKIVLWNNMTMGANPTGILQATDGYWYISCATGLSNGTIVKVDPVSFSATQIFTFDATTNGTIVTPLYEYNGKFYGATQNGTASDGCLFEFNPVGNTYLIKNNFSGTPNGFQISDLILSNGYAYCYSMNGGNGGISGALKKISLNTGTQIFDSYNFNNTTGAEGSGPMVLANNGKIYIPTLQGGTFGYGSIVSVDTSNGNITPVYHFTGYSDLLRNPSILYKFNSSEFVALVSPSSGGAPTNLRVYAFNTNTNTSRIIKNFANDEGNTSYGKIVACNDNTTISITAPSINICNNDTLVLNASINNTTYLKQWFVNGTSIVGETSSNLSRIITSQDTGSYYCEVYTPCGTLQSNRIHINVILCDSVYPGDANRDGIVNGLDVLNVGVAYNAVGNSRTSISNTWMGYDCADWQYLFYDGKNFKHADCNGDGIINNSDTIAISLNWNNVHPVAKLAHTAFTNPVPPYIYAVPASLNLSSNQSSYIDFYFQNDSLNPVPIYGLNTSFNWNPSLLANNSNFSLTGNMLETSSGLLHLTKYNPGSYDVTESRTNQTDTAGSGYLGRLNFTTANLTTSDSLRFSISNLHFVNHFGIKQNVNIGTIPVIYINGITGIKDVANKDNTISYFDPFSNELVIKDEESTKKAIVCLFDISGREIFTGTKTDNLMKIGAQQFANGIYLLELRYENKRITKRVVITR